MSTEQINTATEVGKLRMPYPIMNAAGTVKTIEEVKALAEKSEVGMILVGSYTKEPKKGNLGRTYYYDPIKKLSLNSIGLTNGGMPYLEKHLKAMVKIAKDNNKLLGLSVSEKSIDNYATIFQFAEKCGVSYFEVNTACGNIISPRTGNSYPLSCYDLSFMEKLLAEISHWHLEKTTTIGIKVGSYPNFCDIEPLADMINKSKVRIVVTTNTFKTSIPEKNDYVIDPDNGYGGLGGSPLLYTAIGQVRKWNESLNEKRHVFGVGGIFTGEDMQLHMQSGAKAVQVATAFLQEGQPKYEIFSEIMSEYYSK